MCQLKGRPGRKTGPFLPHRRRPPSLVLGSLQSQKTVLGRGVRCPAAHDLPGCCSRSSSRQSPVAAAAAGRRPLWRAGRGEAAVQSRARRQRGHWLSAVTPRGAAAAASADWRAGGRVRAARAVLKPLHRGLAPPPHPPGTTTPPLCPELQMQHLGSLPAAVPARPPRIRERARKARSLLGRTHRALRALQQSQPGRCALPRPSHLHIPRPWPISERLSRSGWLLPGRKGSGWRRMRRGGRLEPRLLLL